MIIIDIFYNNLTKSVKNYISHNGKGVIIMAKTKVSLTPQQITEQWSTKMKNSVSRIQTGIDNVTESPMAKAAAQKTKMLANLTNAVNNGRWEAGLMSVSLGDWKTVTKAKVASGLAAGVDNAKTKHQKFSTYLANTINAILPQINAAPKMTIEDSINRVRMMVEHMHNNPYKGNA